MDSHMNFLLGTIDNLSIYLISAVKSDTESSIFIFAKWDYNFNIFYYLSGTRYIIENF